MFDQLVAAILERLKSGHTEEAIKGEVLGAGHPESTFTAALEAAKRQLGTEESSQPIVEPAVAAPPSAATPVTATPAVAVESTTEATPAPLSTPSSGSPSWVVGALAALVLLGLAGAGYASYQLGLFGGAPYDSDGELMMGLLDSFGRSDRLEFAWSGDLSLTPVSDMATPEHIAELDQALGTLTMQGIQVPSEGHARFSIGGLVAVTDQETEPEFDMTLKGGLELEPFAFTGEMAYRMVDGRMYGKLVDVPAVMEAGLGNFPLNQWIEIERTQGIDLENIPAVPSLMQGMSPSTFVEALVNGTFLTRVRSVGDGQSAALAAGVSSMPANLIDSIDEDVFSDADKAALIELLRTEPLFTIVDEPNKESLNDSTVYRYKVELDKAGFDALTEFVMERMRKAGASEFEIARYERSLPNQVFFDEIARLTDIYFFARSDGTIVRNELLSELNLGNSPTGLRIMLAFDWKYDTNRSVEVPTDVYEKTLEEIQAEQQAARIREMTGPRNQNIMSNVQLFAENYRMQNGSYSGLCAVDEMSAAPPSFVCNDEGDQYRAYADAATEGMVICVDSSRYLGEVSQADVQSLSCQ